MTYYELIMLALGLSMDAAAACIGIGMSVEGCVKKNALYAGIWFGGFQGLMPIVGYWMGQMMTQMLKDYSHILSFAILAVMGADMIKNAVIGDDNEDYTGRDNGLIPAVTMLGIAVATSIDAMAAGITLAFNNVNSISNIDNINKSLGTITNIISCSCVIGLITFIMSVAGVYTGSVSGGCFGSRAKLFGGIILVILAVKMLLQ